MSHRCQRSRRLLWSTTCDKSAIDRTFRYISSAISLMQRKLVLPILSGPKLLQKGMISKQQTLPRDVKVTLMLTQSWISAFLFHLLPTMFVAGRPLTPAHLPLRIQTSCTQRGFSTYLLSRTLLKSLPHLMQTKNKVCHTLTRNVFVKVSPNLELVGSPCFSEVATRVSDAMVFAPKMTEWVVRHSYPLLQPLAFMLLPLAPLDPSTQSWLLLMLGQVC